MLPSFNNFNFIVFKDHISPIETIRNELKDLHWSKISILQHIMNTPAINNKIINDFHNQVKGEYDIFLSRCDNLKLTFHDQLNCEHDARRSQYNPLTFAMELFEYQLSVHWNIYQRFTSDAFQDVPTFIEELDEQLIINEDDIIKMSNYIYWAQISKIKLSSIKEEGEELVEDIASLTECESLDDESDEDDEPMVGH